MVKPEEIELFDGLSRNAKLRAWLNDELARETKVLYQSSDIDQLRKAQGKASAWQTMLRLMDECPGVAKR